MSALDSLSGRPDRRAVLRAALTGGGALATSSLPVSDAYAEQFTEERAYGPRPLAIHVNKTNSFVRQPSGALALRIPHARGTIHHLTEVRAYVRYIPQEKRWLQCSSDGITSSDIRNMFRAETGLPLDLPNVNGAISAVLDHRTRPSFAVELLWLSDQEIDELGMWKFSTKAGTHLTLPQLIAKLRYESNAFKYIHAKTAPNLSRLQTYKLPTDTRDPKDIEQYTQTVQAVIDVCRAYEADETLRPYARTFYKAMRSAYIFHKSGEAVSQHQTERNLKGVYALFEMDYWATHGYLLNHITGINRGAIPEFLFTKITRMSSVSPKDNPALSELFGEISVDQSPTRVYHFMRKGWGVAGSHIADFGILINDAHTGSESEQQSIATNEMVHLILDRHTTGMGPSLTGPSIPPIEIGIEIKDWHEVNELLSDVGSINIAGATPLEVARISGFINLPDKTPDGYRLTVALMKKLLRERIGISEPTDTQLATYGRTAAPQVATEIAREYMRTGKSIVSQMNHLGMFTLKP